MPPPPQLHTSCHIHFGLVLQYPLLPVFSLGPSFMPYIDFPQNTAISESLSKKRLHPEPAHAATVFTPLLLSPDNLSFVDDLCHGHRPTPLQVIGRGGCGEVYHGDLISADRTVPVAIKKVVYPSLGATQLCAEESKFLDHRMRQIRSEIKTVSRMRHPNLVRLLAHVPQPGSHCLVYEYMPHGS
ncbi:leucine-rich repeat receptor-like serine/threonine/tyrosine-protein kinase SOBIR1 [Carex littledalei]|uniref:Leucine-rich repeat receptor-like serine/threonine/tyrosine-protein kinase SOBIR1 n=1 Tax=Carex littledalei TaxID=544730 RepID=A0A833VWA1_9POAL|nr:leucine-rich repeat receptor-like serine/threonine/tyrosine-protein kinase SOBIR1 [Carex littledalei]